MSRPAWLLWLVALSGCAGATPPPSREPKPTVVEAPKPVAEKAPPPAPRPLPVVAMELEMRARNVDVRVGPVRARPLDPKLIAEKLPQIWRARFEAALPGTAKLEKARGPVSEAHFASLSCDPDKCDAAEKKYDELRAAFDKESERIRRAHTKITDAFEKQLEKAPSVELALAVAWLHDEASRQADIAVMNQPAESGFDYGDAPSVLDDGGSSLATPALERAKERSEATTELGRLARYALMTHRWATGEADEALAEVVGLLAQAPAAERFELFARQALLLGHQGEHQQAAEAFARALAEPEVKGEAVSRAQLRSARVVAEYRAGRFKEALALALAELDRARPSQLAFVTASTAPELRLAADAVERLGVEVESLSATAETRARLLGELALRAAHRHDVKRAAALAGQAVALSPKSSADAFSVLIALAKQKGDDARARELEEQKKAAGAYLGVGAMGILAALGSPPKTASEHDERKALDADAKADGKRNVASLVRLCLEPSFWRLPLRGGEHAVDVDATLLDDGSIQVEVAGDVPAEIADCLRSMGPKVLAHAPASIKAHVDLGKARQSALFWGEGPSATLGGLVGSGGLGLRGGGGSGQGSIGLGSLGTRGVGAGAGSGYGRGAGRLGGRPKPPAKNPKLEQQKKPK